MLRIFYIILCFLIYIELSFCSEFISEKGSRRSELTNRNSRQKHRRHKLPLKRTRRNEEDDKEFVAQIDLANFMQPENEYNTADDSSFEKDKHNYGNYEPLKDFKMPQSDSEHTKELHNLEIAYGMYGSKMKSTDNAPSDNNNSDKLKSTNFVHKPQKKCSDKHMKFPFFSRKKNRAQKFKRAKKRKLLSFHPPTGQDTAARDPKIYDADSIQETSRTKLSKRSNFANICPLCKRKTTSKNIEKLRSRNKRISPRIIHNSRQFFQEAALAKINQRKENHNFIPAENGEIIKRHENVARPRRREEDRERQLKELDEVQKKVDNVRVAVPKFMPIQ